MVVSEFAKWAPILRKAGFRKDWGSRAGGCRIAVWVKIVGDRKLELQIWEDGGHRISHFHTTRYTEFGCMCTTPTEFKSIDEFKAAVQHESTRKDHRR